MVKESWRKKEGELEEVGRKISKNQEEKTDNRDLEEKKEKFEKALVEIDGEIGAVKEKLNELKKIEEEKRAGIFRLQREGQGLQNEINDLGNQMNSIRVESAKYETKLEDLEADIREVTDNLRQIQEEKLEAGRLRGTHG
jgi:chromosome segregation ATPase